MNSENTDRLVAPEIQDGESQDLSLRPTRLGEYIGQSTVKENLRVFIHAARKRGQALDHVLLTSSIYVIIMKLIMPVVLVFGVIRSFFQ